MADDFPFQMTTQKAGYNVTLRATTAAGLVQAFKDFETEAGDIGNTVSTIDQILLATGAINAPSPSPQTAYQGPSQTGSTLPPNSSGSKTCQHGTMLLKGGGGGDTGKKEWRGYFCPSPKGDPTQCPVSWVKI